MLATLRGQRRMGPYGGRLTKLLFDRAIRHRKSCVRGLQGLQIVRGEIFLPSEIVGS
jgi:hypothetical protein